MRCHEIQEHLSAYIDGMLDSSLTGIVEKHMSACGECRLEYEDLCTAISLLKELPEVAPPLELRAILREKLMTIPVPVPETKANIGFIRKFTTGKWIRSLAAAAVICLTVGVTALWYDKYDGHMFNPVLQEMSGDEARVQYDTHQKKTDNNYLADSTGETIMPEEPGTNSQQLRTPIGSGEETASPTATPEVSPPVVDEGEPPEGMPGFFGLGGGPESEYSIMMQEPVEQQLQDQSETTQQEPMLDNGRIPQTEPEEMDTMMKMSMPPEPALNSELIAMEYEVTYVKNFENTNRSIDEVLDKYSKYGIKSAESEAYYRMLRIPVAEIELFLDELSQIGKVEYDTISRDLTFDIQQVRDKLNSLRDQEQNALEQDNPDNNKADLDLLRSNIAKQEEILANLIQEFEYATVKIILE